MIINPVLQKYAEIREAGKVAYKKGSVKPFAGFPESLKKRVILVCCPDGEIISLMWTSNVRFVSGYHSLRFLVGGRDFPLHSTILEGEADNEVLRHLFSAVLLELQETVTPLLRGCEIVFDQLIADAAGSVILAAREIPECVLTARRLAAECYESERMRVLPLEHILHSTQVRITGFLGDEYTKSSAREDFHREVEAINTRLEKCPLKFQVKEVRLVQTHTFLTSYSS